MDKEIKTSKKYLIRRIVYYVSEHKWAQFLCVFAGLGLSSIVSIIICDIFFIFPTALFVWGVLCLLWLLILLFFSFYRVYSLGIDEGYELAKNPQKKIIEIRDTWPSHIFHTCKTLILLLFVIFFFLWFIVYRLGKWKGRKKYWVLDKERKEEDVKRIKTSEQKKYTYEYYDNPNDHTPNDYGYTSTNKQ